VATTLGSPKLHIIFHKRATKYMSFLRELSHKDKGTYEFSPPCTMFTRWRHIYILYVLHTIHTLYLYDMVEIHIFFEYVPHAHTLDKCVYISLSYLQDREYHIHMVETRTYSICIIHSIFVWYGRNAYFLKLYYMHIPSISVYIFLYHIFIKASVFEHFRYQPRQCPIYMLTP